MKANLLRLQNEWETVQASRDLDAIYQYLSAIFELVSWRAQEGRASTGLTGRCTCEDTIQLGSRKPSQPSFVARLILQRLMIARGANGPVCYGTPRNTRTWMSRCGISSSAGVVSTNERPGLLVAGLRRSQACAIKTHRLFMLSF